MEQNSTPIILLVEDEETLRVFFGELLKNWFPQYETLTAPNGRVGLELFSEKKDAIAIVITDITMPEMDGRELFRRIRELSPEIKVIFISGLERPTDEMKNPGVWFLQKPFCSKIMVEEIKKALEMVS